MSPQGVHQRAAPVRQNHHALAVAYLLKEILHHRTRVGHQIMIAGNGSAQVATADVFGFKQTPGGQQARRQAASP